MEKVPKKTTRTLREHLEEVIEIAWDHDAEEAYRIVKGKWEIGSIRSFRDFLNKEHITTYQKTAAETMTLEEKESFIRKWTETIKIINKWRRKK